MMDTVLTSVAQAMPGRLTALLRQRDMLGRGRVVSVEHRVMGAWNSASYYLELGYSPDAPADAPRHLFLKMNVPEQFDQAEVEFYRFVRDKRAALPMLVPCYDAALSVEEGASHLVLAGLLASHLC